MPPIKPIAHYTFQEHCTTSFRIHKQVHMTSHTQHASSPFWLTSSLSLQLSSPRPPVLLWHLQVPPHWWWCSVWLSPASGCIGLPIPSPAITSCAAAPGTACATPLQHVMSYQLYARQPMIRKSSLTGTGGNSAYCREEDVIIVSQSNCQTILKIRVLFEQYS